MQSFGSQQLRLFRRAIRDGATLTEACDASVIGDKIAGRISEKEGAIYLAMDAKNPPPPEAYELIYDPSARKEPEMATAPKDDDYEGKGSVEGEYKRPDAAAAFKIYDDEIKSKLTHIATIKGDLSEPHKRIKDECNFPRPVLNFIVALENMEDAKRDHYLLALSEGFKARRLFMPRDLVTMANGEAETNVVPLGDRRDAGLATLAEEEFTEATDEELAAQRDRKVTEEKPAAGTAAEAMKGMNAKAKDKEPATQD